METRDLQTFIAVTACGGVTRAAEMLGRSQPYVTRTIQDLETELGFDLFIRVGRRMQLTEEGVAFEEEARRLILSFSELAARAKSIAAGKGRIFQVATTAAVGVSLIPKALARLGLQALPTEVHVAQMSPSAVAQEVRAGRSDVGFSSLPLDTPGLEVLRLFSAPDVVALREDDPLASEEIVPLSAFHGRGLVTMLNPLRFQGQVARSMEAHGVVPSMILRTNVSLGALQMVRETAMAAIIDPLTAYGVTMREVVIRRLDVSMPFHWGIIAAADRPLRPLATSFIDAIEATALETVPGLCRLDPALAADLAGGLSLPDSTGHS